MPLKTQSNLPLRCSLCLQDWAYLHREHGLSTFLAVRIADAHGRPLGVLCLATTATNAYQEEWWVQSAVSSMCC
jgi:hypothetical protein